MSEVHIRVGNGNVRILLSSMYLPYDSPEAPPLREMRQVVSMESEKEASDSWLRCQCPSHYMLETDINHRGEQLLHFIAEANLVIVNKGAGQPFSKCEGGI